MPQRVAKHRQRAVISRLIISALTLVARSHNNGKDFDDVLIGWAILQGQTEGRPMTIGKLAQYLGLPRTTVLRRVAAMIARGYVLQDDRKRLTLSLEILNKSESLQVSQKLRQMIQDACAELSKVDT